MKISPRVSIGLPVYNGERYLKEAIDTILAQTYQDFELIISDNASTDATESICHAFTNGDARIRYYRYDYNVGAAANFNKTFDLATGKYFKWAAHDDLCAPEFLARCVEVLDRDAGVVLAYPRATLIGSDGEVLEPYTLKLPTDSPDPGRRFAALLRGHKCYEVFGLIRRDALARTPLMGGYAHGDGVLLARLAFLGRFEEIPEYLFFPRRHPEQSSSMISWSGAVSPEEYRQHAAWFNPVLANQHVFPYWRIHLEFFRSIHDAPVGWVDRLRCYRVLVKKMFARRQVLLGDIAVRFRRFHKPRNTQGQVEAG